MLVVLNSSIATKRQYIAQQLGYAINNLSSYAIGDYTVNFNFSDDTNYSFKIYDSNGTKVYGDGISPSPLLVNIDSDGSQNEEGLAIFNQANAISKDTVSYHFYDDYADWVFKDYGIQEDGFDLPIQNILDVYEARQIDKLVVSGSFAKSVIDVLKTELGDNLKVINLTRNPSASYIFNKDFTEDRPSTLQDQPSGMDASSLDECPYLNDELASSLFSSISVSSIAYATQIKFEDIISNQQFIFDGVTVNCNMFTAYNSYIDQYEKDTVIPEMEADGSLSIKTANLTTFNSIVSDMNASLTHSTNNQFKDEINTNYFNTLGYTPLDYSTIISNE